MHGDEVERILEYNSLSPGRRMLGAWFRLLLINAVMEGTLLLKRLIDIVGAIVGIIVFSPFMIAAAVAIKLEDGGPIFYRQTRIGKDGKPFEIIKFRSMRLDADRIKKELLDKNETGGPTFKMKNDPRITKVGRIIRKLSIDEMPQFFNVLKGEMSLVGPRPPIPDEVAQYGPHERRRLDVKPGLTCIWQVSGRSDIPFEGQVLLDIQYIRKRSLWEDITLILKTIPAVLLGRGAY